MEGLDPISVAVRLLDQHQIIIRSIPWPPALRASFHFYNTMEEAERLAAAVDEVMR